MGGWRVRRCVGRGAPEAGAPAGARQRLPHKIGKQGGGWAAGPAGGACWQRSEAGLAVGALQPAHRVPRMACREAAGGCRRGGRGQKPERKARAACSCAMSSAGREASAADTSRAIRYWRRRSTRVLQPGRAEGAGGKGWAEPQ